MSKTQTLDILIPVEFSLYDNVHSIISEVGICIISDEPKIFEARKLIDIVDTSNFSETYIKIKERYPNSYVLFSSIKDDIIRIKILCSLKAKYNKILKA